MWLNGQRVTHSMTEQVQAISPEVQELYTRLKGKGDRPDFTSDDIAKALMFKAEQSLRSYIELAWHVLEPSNPFVSGWHLDAICEHLQAISNGEIHRLIINIPFRHLKSLSCSAFWPSWEWGPNNHPEVSWLYSSYADTLSMRDSRKTRNLILSPWYQRNWGDRFAFTSDQNAKHNFDNDKSGFRIATTIRSFGTGEGADRVVVDDPHNVMEVESLTKRLETLRWWDESMSNRTGKTFATTAWLIIMSRSHDRDLSGHTIAKETGYEHLCLPWEYKGKNRIFTSLGKVDPRTEVGELLWPEGYNEAATEQTKKDLNSSYAVAGQMQQDPVPREGGGFNINNFEVVRVFDRKQIVQSVRY